MHDVLCHVGGIICHLFGFFAMRWYPLPWCLPRVRGYQAMCMVTVLFAIFEVMSLVFSFVGLYYVLCRAPDVTCYVHHIFCLVCDVSVTHV